MDCCPAPSRNMLCSFTPLSRYTCSKRELRPLSIGLIAQYDDLVDRIFDDVRAAIFPHQALPARVRSGPAARLELTNGEIEVGALRSVGYGIAIHLRARAARRYD